MAEEKITAPEEKVENSEIPAEELEGKEDRPEEGGENTEKDGKEVSADEDKVEKVPTRLSAQQHIIARQKRTIEKLRSKADEEVEPEVGEEEQDETLTPEVQAAVDRQIQKRLSPVIGTIASKADEDELQALFTAEPEAKKYEKRIRAHMEVWKNVPARSIYQSLAFASTQAAAGKARKVADKEADQLRGAGTPRRPAAKNSKIPSAEEISEMDDKEFEELQDKVRQGAYK